MALLVVVLTTLIATVYTETKNDNFSAFLEDRLIVHTQALEHLIKSVDRNEKLTQKLIDRLGKESRKEEGRKQRPRKEKDEISEPPSRRMNNERENPIEEIGKSFRNFRRYGSFITNVVVDEIQSTTEAQAYIEANPRDVGLLAIPPRFTVDPQRRSLTLANLQNQLLNADNNRQTRQSNNQAPLQRHQQTRNI